MSTSPCQTAPLHQLLCLYLNFYDFHNWIPYHIAYFLLHSAQDDVKHQQSLQSFVGLDGGGEEARLKGRKRQNNGIKLQISFSFVVTASF